MYFNVLIVNNISLYVIDMFTIYVYIIIVYTATLLLTFYWDNIKSSSSLIPTHQNYKFTCTTFSIITILYSATRKHILLLVNIYTPHILYLFILRIGQRFEEKCL